VGGPYYQYVFSQPWTVPSPSPAPPATAWRFGETSVRAGPGLGAATPVAVYWGGPTPCRRRLNIHRQCPKIGMQKPAYPTDCIRGHPQAALEAATRTTSLALGGILNLPPRLLVEENGASHPLRESGGGLGMVLSLAKHVLLSRTDFAAIRNAWRRTAKRAVPENTCSHPQYHPA